MPEGELISVTINEGIKKFSELGRHDNSNDDKTKYKKVCVGDIAYNSMRMWQGASGYSPYEGIVSPAYTVLIPSKDIDSKCLSYQFKIPEIIHTFQINSQGITSDNWNLKYPALSEIQIYVSTKIKEQHKIALFFNNLDNLITLHHRKYFCSNNLIFTITTAWEQRKLHEFADKVIEKNIGLQYLETFTNSAEFGIISQKDFFDHSISKIESLEGYYIVKNNNFVYNPRISTTAPVGPINRNKLGRTGVMSPLYTVFEANNVNCTFLEYFFRTNKWHPFMILNGDTGARSDRFSIKDDVFFEMPICKPKIDEQIKIGKYLTKFDDLITLHQRECFFIKKEVQNVKFN